MLFANYPYTDLHELNLDWILKKIKELDREVDDFVAFNKITFAGTWDGSDYPKWSIVDDGDGNGYLSIQAVPANVPLTNTDYWQPVSQYTALYNAFDARISALENMEPIFVRPEDFGAVADGATDDRAAIQDAIDSGKPVVFTAGKTYAFKVDNGRGFTIPSGSSLNLNGATLKQLYNGGTTYSLLYMEGVQNVEIFGGTIYGDKDDNLTSTEWCYGIFGRNVAHIFIRDMVVKKCSGDGIEFGDVVCRDIHIDNVYCDNNGRNGLSITNADGVFISNSIFSNTSGHNPQEGIDLEANTSSDVLKNIFIDNCTCVGNVHAGINVLSLADGDSVQISGCTLDCSIMSTVSGSGSSVIVRGCRVTPYAAVDQSSTDWSYGVGFGIAVGCASGSATIYDDVVIDCRNNPGYAIIYAEGVTIPGRYNIALKNIRLSGSGSVERYVLNRGGAVNNSILDLSVGDVVVTANTEDYLTLNAGGVNYRTQLHGRREVAQGSVISGSLASDVVLTSTNGGNLNVFHLQFGRFRIYNAGSSACFLISQNYIGADGATTNRLEVPAGSAVELERFADSSHAAYRFI